MITNPIRRCFVADNGRNGKYFPSVFGNKVAPRLIRKMAILPRNHSPLQQEYNDCIQPQKSSLYFCSIRQCLYSKIAIATILCVMNAFDAGAQVQRLLGLDVSYYQGNISQNTWNGLRNSDNRQFVVIRSSRGGTTGNFSTSTTGTLSQRYDDPYYIQNINRATTAGMFAGSYHFTRPDIIASTSGSGGIPNNGTDEADHFIQMAGPWMRPGYLPPVNDFEAGQSQRTAEELAQFCIDFSNRIYEKMRIRPAIYTSGSYANTLQGASLSLRDQLAKPATLMPSAVSPCYSVLWSARWPNQADPNSIDVQNSEPKDSYTPIYGPWDDYGVTHPWKFWQYASTMHLPSYSTTANLDVDVARGGFEFIKDQLIPAVWWNDLSGTWTTLTNWNSGQTPVLPVPGPGQDAPVGTLTLPTPRLPTSNDTVILERTNVDIAITLDSGTQNIRKLYVREALNITGGSLTINYLPSSDSTTNAAQFSAPVSLTGTATMSAHTLQVDALQTFTVGGGTLKFNRINLMPGGTPAKIAMSGNVVFDAVVNGTNNIANGTGAGSSGKIDLSGGNCGFNVASGADMSVEVPIDNGALTKSGPGTLRLINANTYSGGTTVSTGKLLINNTSGSGTGSGGVVVNGGILGGTGIISGVVTVNSGGTVAPGTDISFGTLTFGSAPTLGGTNFFRIDRNSGVPAADKITRSGGSLTFGGKLVVTNAGATLMGGEIFTLFSASSYTGAFTATNLPTLSNGLNWYLGNLGGNGTIKVNRSPAATTVTVTNTPTQTLQIPIANLIGGATDADGDSLTLAGFDSVSTNGISLSSDGTYISYLNNANVADQFNFTISDGLGGSATSVVQIALNPSMAPTITSGPQSMTVIAGQSVTNTVSASGTQPLSYQWKKNGVSLSNSGNVSGATTTALTLGNISTSDTASYTVVVTNTVGNVTSSAATLTVNYSLIVSTNGPGTVSKQPDQSSFTPGDAVTLTATTNANAMFVNWTGDEISTDNPLTFTITSNKTIIANFINIGSVADIILDNTNAEVAFAGSWQTGTGANKYGSDYRFASVAVGGTTNVTYRPTIVTAGNYDVYIWYPAGGNRCTNAPWSVSFDGGNTNILVNQSINGAKWLLIAGARPFATGIGGFVRLSNDPGYTLTNIVVMADAVKFVYSAVQGQAPIITAQPQSQPVIAGQNATFNVSVIGDPPSYQWRFNGANISGAIASSYTRANCQPSDAGTYSVVVTNAAGSATSSGATLTVNVPPSITAQPQSRTVIAGSNVLFAVSANGDATLNYQWRFNGANISSATASSYTAANVQAGAAGSYSVVVTNASGTATSADAVLVVNVPPSISAQPQTQAVVQGGSVTFNVVASGTAPLSYQWRFGGNPIAGETFSSYTRTNVQLADAGSYSVVITNIAGVLVSVDAVLTVNIPPSITTGPVDQSVNQGSGATFNVVATGTATLSYQWRFNNNPISGATSSSYTRANSQTGDAGSYSVMVTNAFGSATSANAVLSVIVPPSITGQPQSLIASENQTVNFSVAVSGTAPLHYQWRLNEADILDATGSDYSLESAQTSDAGTYSVVVANSAGSITSAPAILTVMTPPSITTQPISQTKTAGTTASFSVIAAGTAPLTYQWNKGTNSLVNGGNVSGATSPQLTLSNLVQTNAGDYFVVMANGAGQATSAVATLVVIVQPAILSQPGSQTGVLGEAVNFSVTATGGALAYQWKKGTLALADGEKVSGATSAILTLSNLATNDAGTYSVVVTNVAGTTSSTGAILTVLNPPTIKTQPLNRTNNAGTTAAFTVLATGSAPLSYQWKKGTNNLVNGGNIFGATTATLTITAVTSLNAGDYSALVSSPAGSISSATATLTVLFKPQILTQPTGLTNNAGTMAIFDVVAAGGNLGYRWKRGTNLNDGGTIFGAMTSSLTLSNVLARDAATNYSVLITNAAGSSSSVLVKLVVISPPEITKQPTNQLVLYNSNAVFRVTATGTAPMTYQWRKGNDDLTNIAGKIAGATTTNLTILSANYSDAGSYSVFISNVLSTATSSSVLLKIVPGVNIVSPVAGASFNSPLVTVTGTASDNGGGGGGLTQVLYQLNGSSFFPATGTTNWVTTISLQTGTNILGVKSVNAAGNESALSTRSYFLNVYSKITLITNGLGRITGVTNQQNLLIGRNYSVTATPGTGQLLSNWTGHITSSNSPLVFMMQTNMVLAANFVPNPFLTHGGIYNGLYYEANEINHARSGFFTFNVTSAGIYSGSFYLVGTNRGFSGKLAIGGEGHFVYTGVPSVTLDFALDFSTNDTEEVHGQVAGDGWVAPLLGDRAKFIYSPRAQATNYTVSFQGTSDGSLSPGGDGFANVTIRTNGLVVISGRLPDDTALVSPVTYISRNGDWPFYAPLYGGKGSAIGWMTNAGATTFQGEVSWIRTMAFGTNYLAGFTNEFLGLSSVLPVLTSTTPLLGSTNARAIFSQGNLLQPFTNYVTFSNNIVRITPGQTNGLLLTLTLANGQFSGSFLKPGTLQRQTLKGILLRDQDSGRGYFLSPQTGYFLLQPY